MKSDISEAAFLGMLARWAYNTNLNRTDWIMKIWKGDPQIAQHLAFKYENYIPEGVNGNEYMLALISLICALDYENMTILANENDRFVRDGWPTYLSYCEESEMNLKGRV